MINGRKMAGKPAAARFGAILAVLASICLISPTASALVVQYSDRTTFDNAITIDSQIDFNSLAGSLQPNPLVIGKASFVSTDGTGLFRTTGIGLPGIYLAAQNFGGIRIDLDSGISAIGFDLAKFFGLGLTDFSITVSDGTSDIASATVAIGNFFSFLGFTSDATDISSITIISTVAVNNGSFEAIEDVTLGVFGQVETVPAPGGVAILLLGLAGLGFMRRSRTSNA